MADMQANKDNEGKAFGHAGIVAAASAVLADLEKGGVLKVPTLPSCTHKLCLCFCKKRVSEQHL